jgi:hypothetical protein
MLEIRPISMLISVHIGVRVLIIEHDIDYGKVDITFYSKKVRGQNTVVRSTCADLRICLC